MRKEWVVRAAQAGKHVVCEKPCAASLADLAEMLEACRRNQVQFMDGVMFMHSRRLDRVRQALDDGQTVGAIRRIASAFSWRQTEEFFASNIRVQSGLEPYGCLGDLGWYCIRFALWAMDWQLPRHVSGHTLCELRHPDAAAPVPTEFSGELFFQGGVSSSFYCSFLTEVEQWAEISGTRGRLRMLDFVLPFFGNETAFETESQAPSFQGCDFKIEPGLRRWTVNEASNGDPTAQESRLFRHFAQQAQSGKLNEAWPQIAFKTQQVMAACQQSARAGGQSVEV